MKNLNPFPTRDEVLAAQRQAPNAPETRAIQSAYDRTQHARRQAARRVEKAKLRLAQAATLKQYQEFIRLMGAGSHATGVRPGYSLRGITRAKSEYLMGAPAVAGGFIAVAMPTVQVSADTRPRFVALLPDFLDCGVAITADWVARQWADELGCWFPEEQQAAAGVMIEFLRRVSHA